jgi:hypothetical protein
MTAREIREAFPETLSAQEVRTIAATIYSAQTTDTPQLDSHTEMPFSATPLPLLHI